MAPIKSSYLRSLVYKRFRAILASKGLYDAIFPVEDELECRGGGSPDDPRVVALASAYTDNAKRHLMLAKRRLCEAVTSLVLYLGNPETSHSGLADAVVSSHSDLRRGYRPGDPDTYDGYDRELTEALSGLES
jgi:hypothetical protein